MQSQSRITFFGSTISYIAFTAGLGTVLAMTSGLPDSIPILDLVLIILASFRLTELLVYDKIFEFVRGLFKGAPKPGAKKTVDELLSCPWCAGVWTATIVVFAYYIIPSSWIFILILAVSGIAPAIQLWINSKK